MEPCTSNKYVKQAKHKLLKNPSWQGDLPIGYLQSVTRDLNREQYPKTNLASGQRGDANLGPPDYKSVPLTTQPHCLSCQEHWHYIFVYQINNTVVQKPLPASKYQPSNLLTIRLKVWHATCITVLLHHCTSTHCTCLCICWHVTTPKSHAGSQLIPIFSPNFSTGGGCCYT